jgi:hypothetical protein
VLRQWLIGKNAMQIALMPEIPVKWQNAMKISTLIDDLCEFRLSWGLNAISMFWKTQEISDDSVETFSPPDVFGYFASMLHFGVCNPIASVILSLGLNNRSAALALSNIYVGEIDPKSVLIWILALNKENLLECTNDLDIQNSLVNFVESLQAKRQNLSSKTNSWVIRSWEPNDYVVGINLEEGMTLLGDVEDYEIHFTTSNAEYLGFFRIKDVTENDRVLNHIESGLAVISIGKLEYKDNSVIIDINIK